MNLVHCNVFHFSNAMLLESYKSKTVNVRAQTSKVSILCNKMRNLKWLLEENEIEHKRLDFTNLV